MQKETRTDRFTAMEDRFAGYEVYDRSGEKIGKVDDLFVDEADRPEYVGVKMGFLGTRSTLIPWQAVSSTDDEGKAITVATEKDTAKDGPAFDDDREITPDFEKEVHSYYGLEHATEERGYYGETETAAAADADVATDEDELRVQRSEEELAAGTREREAGALRVRKRVRTDREQVEVPTRHEEVSVERVPVEGEATEVVEEDVRREEVEIEDDTKRRSI
jgi:stress response protein YsnF